MLSVIDHYLFTLLRRYLLRIRFVRWSSQNLVFLWASLMRRCTHANFRKLGSTSRTRRFDADDHLIYHTFERQVTEASLPTNALPPAGDLEEQSLFQVQNLGPPVVFNHPVQKLNPSSETLVPSGSPQTLSSAGLFTITASEFKRYERNALLPRVHSSSYEVKCLTTSFSSNVEPSGWTSHVHPEGSLYFWEPKRNIFTEANINDARIYSALQLYIQRIESYLMTEDVQLPAGDIDLVLDLRPRDHDGYDCGYYFVDHKTRCLFWLDNHDVIEILEEVKVSYSLSHVGQEIESQYWCHRELFPNNRVIDGDLLHELKDMLIHALGDSMTSLVSTAPYSVAELEKFLCLVNDMKDHVNTVSPGSACTLYRLMRAFSHERFLHLHGQPGARLCRDQCIHGDPAPDQSLLFRCLNCLMFNMATPHITTLRSITVDQLVNQSVWSRAVEKLAAEWKEATLYSALLLNANATVLTVHVGTNSTVAPLACYISTAISIASTTTCLLLMRHAQAKAIPDFLVYRSVSSVGLELLAVMYALPYALLLWGTMCFLAALGCVSLGTTDDIVTSSLVNAITWVILVSIIIWILSLSSGGPYQEPWIIRKSSNRTLDGI